MRVAPSGQGCCSSCRTVGPSSSAGRGSGRISASGLGFFRGVVMMENYTGEGRGSCHFCSTFANRDQIKRDLCHNHTHSLPYHVHISFLHASNPGKPQRRTHARHMPVKAPAASIHAIGRRSKFWISQRSPLFSRVRASPSIRSSSGSVIPILNLEILQARRTCFEL